MTVDDYKKDLGALCQLCKQNNKEAIEAYYEILCDADGKIILDWNNVLKSYEIIYKLAIERNQYAETILAYLIYTGLAEIKDDEDKSISRNWFISSAIEGERCAQYYLGNQYDRGDHFEKDSEQSFFWMKKSAMAGHAAAQNTLGVFYGNGEGTEKNQKEAAKWILSAANLGNKWGCLNIANRFVRGNGIVKNYEKAAFYCLEAQYRGHEKATQKINEDKEIWAGLCSIYYSGYEEYEKDYKQAVYYAQKAANAGMAEGMLILAYCYELGHGVEIDYLLAASYYICAMLNTEEDADDIKHQIWDCENAKTCYFAGKLYALGINAEPFLQKYNWDSAQIDFYKQYGLKAANQKEAAICFMSGAEAGHSFSMSELAKCYEQGKGVEKDRSLAAKWLQKAEEAGSKAAKEKMEGSPSLRSDLALNYYEGKNGYAKDYGKALKIWTENALLGETDDIYNMGKICLTEEVCNYNPALAALYYVVALRFNSLAESVKNLIEKDTEKDSNLKYYFGMIYLNGPDAGKIIKDNPVNYESAYMELIEANITAVWQKYHLIKAYPQLGKSYLDKAIAAGNSMALVYYGDIYRNGIGVEKNLKTAALYYLKAERQGSNSAEEILLDSAELSYQVGEAYYFGEGVDKDRSSAIYWYENAHALGNVDATYSLGFCYLHGQGVDENELEAISYFMIAANKGNISAMCEVGDYFYRDAEKTLNSMPELTTVGYNDPCLAKAMEWYQKGTNLGSGRAMYGLARCYEATGKTLKAFKAGGLYAQSAQKGYEPAIRYCKANHLWY